MHNIKLWPTESGFSSINVSDAEISDLNGKSKIVIDYDTLIQSIDKYKKYATVKFYDEENREYLFFDCKSVKTWYFPYEESNELCDGILEIKIKKDCNPRAVIHFDSKININTNNFLRDYEKINLKYGNRATDHPRSLENAKIELYI